MEIDDESIELHRFGTGISMKIQAKVCTQWGLPNFRAREGDVVPFTPSDLTRNQDITISPRINWATRKTGCAAARLLRHPFPVPAEVRLQPPFPTGFVIP